MSDLAADQTTYDDAPPADGTLLLLRRSSRSRHLGGGFGAGARPLRRRRPRTARSTAPLTGRLTGVVPVHATVSDPRAARALTPSSFQSAPTGTSTWTTFDTGTLNAGVYDGTLDTATITGGDGVYDLRVRRDRRRRQSRRRARSWPACASTRPRPSSRSPRRPLREGSRHASPSTPAQPMPRESPRWSSRPRPPAPTRGRRSTPTAAGPSPYHGSLNTATLGGDGTYDVRAVATDVVGNPASTATVANVVVDNTLPSGTLTAPPANIRGTVVDQRDRERCRRHGGRQRRVPELARAAPTRGRRMARTSRGRTAAR